MDGSFAAAIKQTEKTSVNNLVTNVFQCVSKTRSSGSWFSNDIVSSGRTSLGVLSGIAQFGEGPGCMPSEKEHAGSHRLPGL